MRFVVVFVIAIGLAGSARAEEPAPRPLPTEVTEPPRKVNPTELMRERQKIEEAGGGGRSGFWTSRQPAQNGAYRWRLLGLGLVLIVVMGLAILYLIRRANRANAARPDRWASKKPLPAKTPEKFDAATADNSAAASSPSDEPRA